MLNHQYAHFFSSNQRLEMTLHESLGVQTLAYQEVSFPNPFFHLYFYDKRRVILKSSFFHERKTYIISMNSVPEIIENNTQSVDIFFVAYLQKKLREKLLF
jgi:hypothetical protein